MCASPYICQILRFKPRFDSFLKDLTINFNFKGMMVAELQIKLGDGELSRGASEQHFIYETLRCIDKRDAFLLFDTIALRIKTLAEQGRTINDSPVDSPEKSPQKHKTYDRSFQAIIEDEGHDWRNFTGE